MEKKQKEKASPHISNEAKQKEKETKQPRETKENKEKKDLVESVTHKKNKLKKPKSKKVKTRDIEEEVVEEEVVEEEVVEQEGKQEEAVHGNVIIVQSQVPDSADIPEIVVEQSSTSRKTKLRDYTFNDGVKRIDMVLVSYVEAIDSETEAVDNREKFEWGLMQAGLELEKETEVIGVGVENRGSHVTYVKIHVSDDVLLLYAKVLGIQRPVRKPQEMPTRRRRGSPIYGTDELRRMKKRDVRFLTAAQRSLVVWNILLKTAYGSDENQIGIKSLLADSIYYAAYPLHDGKQKDIKEKTGRSSHRKLLFDTWAQIHLWRKNQPLWDIKLYFGDKIALYFAWLGFYTHMLFYASVIGVICCIYGTATLLYNSSENIPSEEVCDEDSVGSTIMCPICYENCPYTHLIDSCWFVRMSYLVDNHFTVAFAIFMSFWATTFLETWKRHHAVLVWKWSLIGDEDAETRPDYEKAVKKLQKKRINQLSLQEEMYIPTWSLMWRRFATASTVLFMMSVVVSAILGTIAYRVSVTAALHRVDSEAVQKSSKLIAAFSSAIINLIIIIILTKLYEILAHKLTKLENPRTQPEYENSYTFKMFVLQFVNYYSSLIYIAFIKGHFFTHPGAMKDNILSSMGSDICDPAGCLSEVFIQLSIIMVGKQVINNIIEYLLPTIKNKWTKWRHRSIEEHNVQWKEDLKLQDYGQMGLFDEYLEMVIQYGFVTLFVAAFPLAPVFALLNNLVEIRVDSHKLVTQYRRPIAERVNDIGAWFGILQAITFLSVVTNAFVISYTSDFIPRLLYKYQVSQDASLVGYIKYSLSEFNTSDFGSRHMRETNVPKVCYFRGYRKSSAEGYDYSDAYWYMNGVRLGFVVLFEHIVFALTGILAYAIPDIPEDIRNEMRREKLLQRNRRYTATQLKWETSGHNSFANAEK